MSKARNILDLLVENVVIDVDMDKVKNSLQRDYMSGPTWYANGVKKLSKAIQANKTISFNVDDYSKYGGKIIAIIDGEKIQITKKKLKTRDINTIFGKIKDGISKSSGVTTSISAARSVNTNDISKVKPKRGAGMGETVKLKNGQVWEFKGISGYMSDNKNRIYGWERVK